MIVQSVIQCSVLQDKPCSILHPWTPYCRHFLLSTFRTCTLGSLQLFGTVAVLKLALKLKKHGYQLEDVLEITYEALQSSTFLSLIFTSSQCLVCLFRAVVGRFTNFSSILLPTCLGALCVSIERTEKLNLYMFLASNCILEYMLRSGMRSANMTVTPRLLTAIFMMSSGILLEILSRPHIRQLIKSGDSPWFFFPSVQHETKSQESNKIKHILREMKATGLLVGKGLCLQLGQIVLKNITRPSHIIRKIFRFETYRLGLFLGIYTALFKFVRGAMESLDKKTGAAWHGIVAGFVAGTALIIYPDSFIAIMATTALLQIVCKLISQKGYGTHKLLWKYIHMSVSVGFLVHIYFVDHPVTPKWIARLIETIAGDIVKEWRRTLRKEWCVAQFPIAAAGIY